MPAPEYPEAVMEYVQAQGWTTDITELRDGAYIVAGSRETDSGSETMLLMVVCEPEDEVTSEHVKYLLKAGREKNVGSVLLTHTVGITENAQEIGKEYDVGVIDSEKVRSHAEASDFGVDTDEISIPGSESKSQGNLSGNSNLEERAAQIVAQAAGSSITKELLLGQESTSEDAEQILADQPLIEYLNDNEIPEYIFWGEHKGFDCPGNAIKPDRHYRAVCSVSKQRILLVVGQVGGDQVISIPRGAVTGIEISHGLGKHRLIVETSEEDFVSGGKFHIYFNSDSAESKEEIQSSVEFVRNNLVEPSGPGAITRNFSSEIDEDDFIWSGSDYALFTIVMIVAFPIAMYILFSIFYPIITFFFGTTWIVEVFAGDDATDPEQEIDRPAEELILTLNEMPSEWQGSAGGNETHAEATFTNPDEISSEVLVIQLQVHEDIDSAEEEYGDQESTISDRVAVSEADIGHESIVWEEGDGAAVYFRDSEVTAIVSYADSTAYDPEGEAIEFAEQLVDNFE